MTLPSLKNPNGDVRWPNLRIPSPQIGFIVGMFVVAIIFAWARRNLAHGSWRKLGSWVPLSLTHGHGNYPLNPAVGVGWGLWLHMLYGEYNGASQKSGT